MAESLTAALIVAGILGLSFANTRAMAIAAISALAFMFPWLAALLVTGLCAFSYIRIFRK